MNIGEPFSPYRLFTGVFIPDALIAHKGINAAEKICLARLYRYCGKDQVCFPSQEELSDELGVEVRTVGTYIHNLCNEGFIKIEQRGLGKTNQYRMLRHAVFCETGSDLPVKTGSQTSNNLPVQASKDTVIQDRQYLADPTYSTEESHIKRVITPIVPLPAAQEIQPQELDLEDSIEVFAVNAYSRLRGLKLKLTRRQDILTLQHLQLREDSYGAEYLRDQLLGYLEDEAVWLKENKWPLARFLQNPEAYKRKPPTAPPLDDAQDTRAGKAVVSGTVVAADAPQAAQTPNIDYPARWNELVPAMRVEWDWKRSNVEALLLAGLDDVFVARFDEICLRVQKIHTARPGDQKYLTFNWILKREGRKGPYNWFKVLQDFEWMETPDKSRGVNSEIRGPWRPGIVCNSDEDFDAMRAWKEKRCAQNKHTDHELAAKEGDIT